MAPTPEERALQRRGNIVPDADTANELGNALREGFAKWERSDEWMLKAGLILLLVSFLVRFFMSVPPPSLG